jgi:acyl carrier protein
VTATLTRQTALFGNLPELDSMAVATVLTALEDRFHILIDDDEVSGAMFETVGALADFVASKEPTGKAAKTPSARARKRPENLAEKGQRKTC